MSKEKVLKLIKILSFIGIIVASYSLYEYYFGAPSDFCNINEAFNCYQVAKSGYSDILGVPIALFGMIGFGLIFTCAAWNREGKNMHKFLLPLTLLSLLSVFYFIYLSAFVIHVWCPACIVSWIIIVTLFILSVLLGKRGNTTVNS
ncbi:MAG: Vitamin K epoxide reductase [Parcubacteria group bacterium GW2011_GWD2_38_12]|nr:MAG: Vitamin K epoxide reductase [Candidatus Moranbacteria bacterium GW2011_GWF2_37_7]KKQ52032.1 MAG: Vitamin K epoxide reductase [Parcubacteria group bacterium GW2011_GWD2_38_12]